MVSGRNLPPIRIAHISDTHLGYRAHFRSDATGRNARARDIERAYEHAIDGILDAAPIDLVVHTGDVFHQSRPSWTSVVWFIAQTRRLEALGCPIIVIAGNHDMSQLRTPDTVFSVLAYSLPNVTFVAGFEWKVIDLSDLRLQVTAVPHGALGAESVRADMPGGYRTILLTHGLAPTLADSPRHEAGETTLSPELLGGGYDLVLLGHFHLAEKVNANTWYAGSTERIGWNDLPTDPGWALVTIGEDGQIDVDRRRVESRPMAQVTVGDPTGKTARDIADEVLDLARRSAPAGAMIRADLTGVDRTIRRSAETMIRRDGGDEFFWVHTYSRDESTFALSNDDRASGHMPLKGLADLFADFCAEEIAEADFRNRFAVRGSDAIAEALRSLEATLDVPE
jgi:DNA repair exonuclease SbcCD nuclease subunit